MSILIVGSRRGDFLIYPSAADYEMPCTPPPCIILYYVFLLIVMISNVNLTHRNEIKCEMCLFDRGTYSQLTQKTNAQTLRNVCSYTRYNFGVGK